MIELGIRIKDDVTESSSSGKIPSPKLDQFASKKLR